MKKRNWKMHLIVFGIIVLAVVLALVFDRFQTDDEFSEGFCRRDLQCETPDSYVLQSNCPFSSACLEGSCRVICPLYNECSRNEDCNCSFRGEKTLECLCHKGICVSVEE